MADDEQPLACLHCELMRAAARWTRTYMPEPATMEFSTLALSLAGVAMTVLSAVHPEQRGPGLAQLHHACDRAFVTEFGEGDGDVRPPAHTTH